MSRYSIELYVDAFRIHSCCRIFDMKILIPVLTILVGITLRAQPAMRLQFETAAIHFSEPGQPVANFHTDPGSLSTRNVTLQSCIEWAYGLRTLQVNGPAWLKDVRMDITARAED